MTYFSELKKSLMKKLFFYWIKSDFNKNLDLLENYKLRKYVKLNLANEVIEENQIPDLIEYISSFVISTYSNPEKIPSCKENIREEAEFIVNELISGYEIAINGKDYDLIEYLNIPKINITNKQRQLYEVKRGKYEKIIDDISENENIKSRSINENLDEIFALIDMYYKKNCKKFWRPGLKHYAVAIWYIIYICVNDIEKFSEEFSIKYVDDGEQRCLFNYFNLYIHRSLFTGEVLLDEEIRKVIFAASAIHPAQDDYIDKNIITDEKIDIMDRAIRGEKINVKDKDLKVILNLIEIIYNKYPINQNPELVEILIALNKWQKESLIQKNKKNIKEKELLKISFMKGGYAFAFYGYIALGKMDIIEFRHFFGMGSIFQIMDDLHDIEIDLKDGVETIWTKRINGNLKADEAIYGIIGVQRRFEQITKTIDTLKRPVFLRRMELFAVRLDLIKFYLLNRKYFSDDFINKFELIYGIELNDYLDNHKFKVDNIKTMKEFKEILLEIKKSYIKKIIKKK